MSVSKSIEIPVRVTFAAVNVPANPVETPMQVEEIIWRVYETLASVKFCVRSGTLTNV